MFLDVGAHFLKSHTVGVAAGVLDKLVGAVAGLAVLAVHQRVGKTADMTGCNPGRRVHQDGRIQTDVVRGLLHKLLAPCCLDIVLELNTKRAIIPGVRKAAVNLRAGVHKTATLTQGNDFFHGLFAVLHFLLFSFRRIWRIHT